METAENLMGNADTLKNESKEITLTSLNDIQSTAENYRFTISLVLTILTFLVILIFINIIQRLIPKSWKIGLALIVVLSAIFIVTFGIFYYGYNNQILKPLINKSNIIREKIGAEPVDEPEENNWFWWLLGSDIGLIIFILIVLIGVNFFY